MASRQSPFPRFERYFPLAAFLVRNVWKLFPVFGLVAAALGFYSVHYSLSVLCVWMGLVCFWVDRKHLNYCLFTPLQPLATVLVLALGVGVSFVTLDAEEKYTEGFLAMQLVGLLGFPLFIAGYRLVMGNVPGFVVPSSQVPANRHFFQCLIYIGWFCLLHDFGKVLAGVISGTNDKGYGGEFVVETPFGWWSAFGIFPRIQTLGYVLAPVIWRDSRAIGRCLLAGVVGSILFLNFAAGSRGQTIYPVLITVVGCFMFFDARRVKYELYLALGAMVAVPLVTIMLNFRNTEAFRSTSLRDVFSRVATIKEGLQLQAEKVEEGSRYADAGRSFIGVADNVIYEMTPGIVPHEGFDRLDDAVWTVIPYILSQRQRPILQDGYLIVKEYLGDLGDRTNVGITWPAELYRRFGWVGVPLGLFGYGLVYGSAFRFVYRLYLYRNALWGFLICGIFFHFFILWCWSTTLTNIWFWFYEVPKHLALMGLLYFGARALVPGRRQTGALAMLGVPRRSPVRPGQVVVQVR